MPVTSISMPKVAMSVWAWVPGMRWPSNRKKLEARREIEKRREKPRSVLGLCRTLTSTQRNLRHQRFEVSFKAERSQ